jgi:hypothetical protein
MTPDQIATVEAIRAKFDDLLTFISEATPMTNARYLAILRTKLEEASFFAVKGIAKPNN